MERTNEHSLWAIIRAAWDARGGRALARFNELARAQSLERCACAARCQC